MIHSGRVRAGWRFVMATEYQSIAEGFTLQLPPTMLTPVIGI